MKHRRKSSANKTTLDLAVLIDRIFLEPVVLNEGNTKYRVTCIRAIIHQLWQRSLGGNQRASRLYMRYIRFVAAQTAERGFEVRFGPDMLTAEQVMRKLGR
jgi:hypothetical protein